LEVVDMTKSMIVTFFWGSLVGLVTGFVLMGTMVALAISNDIFVMSGLDVTGIKSGALSWTLLGLMGLAVLILLFAAVAHFVAWIGAVLNTAHLPDKTLVRGSTRRRPAGLGLHRDGRLRHRRTRRCQCQRRGPSTAPGWPCSGAGDYVDHDRSQAARQIVADERLIPSRLSLSGPPLPPGK
jgi:hypothetical protein